MDQINDLQSEIARRTGPRFHKNHKVRFQYNPQQTRLAVILDSRPTPHGWEYHLEYPGLDKKIRRAWYDEDFIWEYQKTLELVKPKKKREKKEQAPVTASAKSKQLLGAFFNV